MVRKTFRSLDGVALREAWSLRNVQEYVPGLQAALFPDTAFALTPEDAHVSGDVASTSRSHGWIALLLFRSGPDAYGFWRRREIRVAPDDLGAEAGGAECSLRVEQSRPTVTSRRSPTRPDSLFLDRKGTDYREFMALVAGAQFLVSGRYHNVILAAIMGCPTIAFGSSSHKVHGACEMLDNLVGSPYDGTDLRTELDAIADQAAVYIENREGFAERLRATCSASP